MAYIREYPFPLPPPGRRYPTYRIKESKKKSENWKGPTLGVRLLEVSVKIESTIYNKEILSTQEKTLYIFQLI